MTRVKQSTRISYKREPEKGEKGPHTRQSVWAPGVRYLEGAAGEDSLDFAYFDGYMYECVGTHTSVAGETPYILVNSGDTTHWRLVPSWTGISSKVLLLGSGRSGWIMDEGVIKHTSGSIELAADGSIKTSNGKFQVTKEGTVKAIDGEFAGRIVAAQTQIAGFKISGNGLTNDPFNNDAYIIFRNDAHGAFAGVGGNILPASSGARAVARFENKDTQDMWALGTNYAALLAAQGGRDNVAVQIDGGAISGLNLKNRIISTSGITLTRFDLNAIFVNDSDITIYLPTMQLYDDGHVIRFKRLGSGKINIYTSYCYTYDGLNSRYSRPALIYDDGDIIQDWSPLPIQSKMDSFELVWVRDLAYTVGSTTSHGAWIQYKFPRDW